MTTIHDVTSIKPGEVLIVRVGEATTPEEAAHLAAELARLGLDGRALVIFGNGVEITVGDLAPDPRVLDILAALTAALIHVAEVADANNPSLREARLLLDALDEP